MKSDLSSPGPYAVPAAHAAALFRITLCTNFWELLRVLASRNRVSRIVGGLCWLSYKG